MEYTTTLKKNWEFKRVYEHGKSFGNRLLVLYIRKNGQNENKLGISVSKKVGNSVVRSRVTRLIREAYRLNEKNFILGFDYVFVAKVACNDKSYFDIESAMKHVCKKQEVWKKK